CLVCVFFVFFFFFQAEDGIRDLIVTGVQTCALPILSAARTSPGPAGPTPPWRRWLRLPGWRDVRAALSRNRGLKLVSLLLAFFRSEERRVGKEWRSRWWAER